MSVWRGIHLIFLTTLTALPVIGCDRAVELEGTRQGHDDALPPFAMTRDSQHGLFVVSLWPREGEIPQRLLHDWIVRISEPDGAPIEATRILISGGMPAHGHGLETQPRVTRRLADGSYLIEGMKFHMGGEWTLQIEVAANGQADAARFDFAVGP